MLLAIDIGNTNLTLGLYEGETLVRHWRLATEDARMPDEYGLQFLGLLQNARKSGKHITGIGLASRVPPLSRRLTVACGEYLTREPLVADANVKTSIEILYQNPKAAEADHVCDAAVVEKHNYTSKSAVLDKRGYLLICYEKKAKTILRFFSLLVLRSGSRLAPNTF